MGGYVQGRTDHTRKRRRWDPGAQASALPCSDLGVPVSRPPPSSDPKVRVPSRSSSNLRTNFPVTLPPVLASGVPAQEEVRDRTPPHPHVASGKIRGPGSARPGIPSGMTVGKGMAGSPAGRRGPVLGGQEEGERGGNQTC